MAPWAPGQPQEPTSPMEDILIQPLFMLDICMWQADMVLAAY
jgi:hypothetical protein